MAKQARSRPDCNFCAVRSRSTRSTTNKIFVYGIERVIQKKDGMYFRLGRFIGHNVKIYPGVCQLESEKTGRHTSAFT